MRNDRMIRIALESRDLASSHAIQTMGVPSSILRMAARIEDLLQPDMAEQLKQLVTDENPERVWFEPVRRKREWVPEGQKMGVQPFVVRCFDCGGKMILRNGRYGPFWGCSNYPSCRLTLPADLETFTPLPRITEEEKAARNAAHGVFDMLWKGPRAPMTRKQAYRWMQDAMGLTENEAHISRLDRNQLSELISLVKRELNHLGIRPSIATASNRFRFARLAMLPYGGFSDDARGWADQVELSGDRYGRKWGRVVDGLMRVAQALDEAGQPDLADRADELAGEVAEPQLQLPLGPIESAPVDLGRALESLRPQIAAAAQAVYDEWEQDADGLDPELGSGGICDRISDAMSEVVGNAIPNVQIAEGGAEGDDHAWIIVHDGRAGYAVDIPAHTYEAGGGYSWTKVPDVRFTPDDISIAKVPAEWLPTEEEDQW